MQINLTLDINDSDFKEATDMVNEMNAQNGTAVTFEDYLKDRIYDVVKSWADFRRNNRIQSFSETVKSYPPEKQEAVIAAGEAEAAKSE